MTNLHAFNWFLIVCSRDHLMLWTLHFFISHIYCTINIEFFTTRDRYTIVVYFFIIANLKPAFFYIVSKITEQEVCQMTQKVYHGMRLYVCQSCGWRWNCFEVRECPKCGKNNLDERTK